MEKMVLELKNVTTGSIEDVNMEVEPGAFFVVLGPSGAGKSTLLNLICRNQSIASGTILINGDDINDIAEFEKWRAANIGVIYEKDNLISTLTSIENVELPLWATKIGKDQWRERASTALELVGVIGKTKELPKKLSIGEQQKVALARAIAIEPTLILADEPTGKLDRKETEHLIDLMGELNREKGYTFMVATHDTSFKSRATKVLELSP